MSGLKQFYTKNIKIFTVILVLIALYLAYMCYSKYLSAQKAKEVLATASISSVSLPPVKEGYKTLDEIIYNQLMNPELSSGLDVSNIDLSTRGSFSQDELQRLVRKDIKNIGMSGQQQQTSSRMNDPSLYTTNLGQQDVALF
jgi:hypothetical protein